MPTVDASRVLRALEREPDLLFEVAARLAGVQMLSPWTERPLRRWERFTPTGKVILRVDKLARPGDLWRIDRPNGGYIGKLPGLDTAKALSDYLARGMGWSLIGEDYSQGKQFAVWHPGLPVPPPVGTGIAKTLGGRSVGSVTHDPQARQYRWQVNPDGVDSGTGFAADHEAAFCDLKDALAEYGYTLLPPDVSGLSKPLQPNHLPV
jgi:hypothetical protein